jgi:high-affinity iron transporter
MLPTFVITLREGVEATLIVGIIAAFLVQEGRRDALNRVWLGIGAATVLCIAVAVGLDVVGSALPQKGQEGMETVIGLIAVAAVTYMVVWMRRHARGLKGALQENARSALASGSAGALVAMAFLAVLREGFETSVFLLAVFQDATDQAAAGFGAVLGLVAALAIGFALYKGGLRINLQRFFRITGVVLALVAAGLFAGAVHTAHEAGWWNLLQGNPLDLSGFVEPGTVHGALLTGMLGLQPQPTTGEIAGYLLFAVPLLLFVLWPTGRPRRPARATVMRGAATASVLVAAALVIAACGSGSGSGAKGGTKRVAITLDDNGCTPSDLKLQAGPTTFTVTGGGSGKVTEFEVFDGSRILGEIENVTPGLERSFSVTLKAGSYVLSCTGGSQEPTGKLTVTGSSAAAPRPRAADAAAVTAYRGYLERQTAALVTSTQRFTDAVVAGDVAAAKRLYAPARLPYERIEPVAESIGGLDPAIDAREGDVPKAGWTGFHVIEKALWVDASTQGMAPVARKLQADVTKLAKVIKTVDIEPAQVANGAVSLLGEVSKSKITGEEERYSHTDLVDFAANVEGARAAYEIVAPIVRDRQPDLAQTVAGQFAAVDKLLAPHRKGDGFVSYQVLDESDTRVLSQGIDALAEPLSRVPAQLIG